MSGTLKGELNSEGLYPVRGVLCWWSVKADGGQRRRVKLASESEATVLIK